MDTIKKYLESMFEHLPKTLEVMRAKDELYSMMEDKYNELISEGKKENEAIGIVISEFGNLDELAEGLGLSKVLDDLVSSDRRYVSRQEADDYVDAVVSRRFMLSLGILLCILSPAGPILLDSIATATGLNLFTGIGVAFLFLCAAVGVGFIVFSNYITKSWSFLNKQPCYIDDETIDYLKSEKEECQTGNGMLLAVGIMLCIVSVIPVIVLDAALNVPIISDGVGPSMMFTLAAVGVFLIVFSSGRNKAYKKLLSLNKKVFAREILQQFADAPDNGPEKSVKIERVTGEVVESDYKDASYSSYDKPEQSSDSTEKKVKNFIKVMVKDYWKSVLCIYIIWSFFTFSWGSSWVIWPLAAILRKPIEQYFLGGKH
ncbi:hypothetical protein SAMN04487928_10942 [Butyrivibrio proteoclasticus]|uniref:Uncharacterized protein n=1 Tax=Butyrivibrio proteoclasticus TaxID=43305 RepID=A0A1I5THV5_9FIRM|nr:permease prefix domain 1-containing protein [Butyrivibrio proteoclasticus]SFP82605.1 hypothetical protein SAMN04487928_10942 [Butyrivibrio proteoclasticus]